MGKPQRTIVDEDIHEAALWRLAGFPAEVIDASTARVAQLIKSGVPLESAQPEVAAAMAALKRPGDRRGEWTALMAVVALYADSQGFTRLFLIAGFEVVTAWRNAKARAANQPKDSGINAIEVIMIQYHASQPSADADGLFDMLAKLPRQYHAVKDYDPDSDVLTYADRGREREITRESFARQFRKVRNGQKIFSMACGLQRDAVFRSCKKTLCAG